MNQKSSSFCFSKKKISYLCKQINLYLVKTSDKTCIYNKQVYELVHKILNICMLQYLLM